MKLKSIEEEAADCRAAFTNSKAGDLVNFCHHEYPIEFLTEPAENRITYILKSKTDNVALRLRLFRPAKFPVGDAGYYKALDEYNKAQDEYRKAQDEYNKAWVEYDKALDEYYKALDEYYKALDEYCKTRDEFDKALGEYRKALAKFDKALAEYNEKYLPHFKDLFGVEWKGSIFKTFEEEKL